MPIDLEAIAKRNLRRENDHPVVAEAISDIDTLIAEIELLSARLGIVMEQNREMSESGVPRWIPVTERLPECEQFTLTWEPNESADLLSPIHVGQFQRGTEPTWVDFEDEPYTPTHWQPLPEPPK